MPMPRPGRYLENSDISATALITALTRGSDFASSRRSASGSFPAAAATSSLNGSAATLSYPAPVLRHGQIVRARQHEFPRLFHDAGQYGGLDRDIRRDPPAEAATEILLVHDDLVWRRLQNPGHDEGDEGGELGAGPDFRGLAVFGDG